MFRKIAASLMVSAMCLVGVAATAAPAMAVDADTTTWYPISTNGYCGWADNKSGTTFTVGVGAYVPVKFRINCYYERDVTAVKIRTSHNNGPSSTTVYYGNGLHYSSTFGLSAGTWLVTYIESRMVCDAKTGTYHVQDFVVGSTTYTIKSGNYF